MKLLVVLVGVAVVLVSPVGCGSSGTTHADRVASVRTTCEALAMAQDYLGGRFPTDSTTIEDMFSAQGNPATDDITDLNAFADDVRTGNCSNVDAIVS